MRSSTASNASLDEVRAVWETNVFGVLAVYQAMLPLLRESSDARIVNVSSGVGSLAERGPGLPVPLDVRPRLRRVQDGPQRDDLAMMIELESTDIKVNLVSPGFTARRSTTIAGTETIEDGSREVVRVALLGPDGPTGTFTRWEDETIPATVLLVRVALTERLADCVRRRPLTLALSPRKKVSVSRRHPCPLGNQGTRATGARYKSAHG